MSADREILYIKGERNVEVPVEGSVNAEKSESAGKRKSKNQTGMSEHETEGSYVTLGEILPMECSNRKMLSDIKALKILKVPENGSKRCIISVLKIISCIHEKYPQIEVRNLGAADIIVTFENQKTAGKAVHRIKTAAVVLLTFSGAAFSIMAFHNDISITKLFSQIYEVMTGTKSDGFTILEVSYSLGISVGILLFFNHFGKKKLTVDPTPLEVQMRLYENNIQTTLVENASRKGEELNVENACGKGEEQAMENRSGKGIKADGNTTDSAGSYSGGHWV